MTIRGTIIAAGALMALGGTARAELSCSAYIRGVVLHDPDVLAEATNIAAPLAQAWSVSGAVIIDKLAQDCRALPDDTVDSIVATHLKVALREQKAEAAAKAFDETRHAHYEVYRALITPNLDTTCQDYLSHRPNATTTVKIVWAWSVVEDDHKADKDWREGFHGIGAPVLPPLAMTMEQAKSALDLWCPAHPKARIISETEGAIYNEARFAKFGPEVEDTPAKVAERKKLAAEAAPQPSDPQMNTLERLRELNARH